MKPAEPWTANTPQTSSIPNDSTTQRYTNGVWTPPITPSTIAPAQVTWAHAPVIATSPASSPFAPNNGSGFPSQNVVTSVEPIIPAPIASVVLSATRPSASPWNAVTAPPSTVRTVACVPTLNAYQPNARNRVPITANNIE